MQFTLGRLSICAGKNRSLMVTDIAKAFMPPAASKSEIASRRTDGAVMEVDSAPSIQFFGLETLAFASLHRGDANRPDGQFAFDLNA